ncbi:RHS repeat-associated core domain-containing protein [Georgenia phoenicis]|uniref:RHS repeat-associated core domain-containing protein n=1 Tax=unclassified Georgenia TaxID=2626815 RepID=UPI0039AF2DB0
MSETWTAVAQGSEPIDVTLADGQVVTLQPGQTYETTSACEMLDFLQRRDPDVPLTELNDGALDALLAAGRQEGCVGADGTVATSGAPGTSSVPPPAPPPADGDSAQAQGAPQVPPGVRVDGGTGAPDATTPPAQQPPVPPEEEPRDHPPDEPDPHHGGAAPAQRTLGGDPVDLFTGAFTIEETDLAVDTAALPLEMTRVYRSGRAYYGPFGWGWDHTHNHYLRELADGSVARWTGRLHEERFIPDGPAFRPPAGVFAVLERLPGPATAYRLTGTGGEHRDYARPSGWPVADRIPLVAHRDRHGNENTYTYDGAGRLAEVRDQDDRYLRFHYGECGLLERVEDHAARAVVYEHDPDVEQLVSVRDGDLAVRRAYRHADPWEPVPLRHNIVEVLDGAGAVLVTNKYEKDPASWSWGRVAAQRYGDYLFQLRYTQLQYTPAREEFVDVPSVQVEVMDPEYSVSTSTFNSRGDLLDHRFRLVRDRSFRVVVHQFGYDAQGNRTLVRLPDGQEEHRTYLHDDADPRARGLLVRREVRARPGFPAPSRVMWRGTYEPVFQLPRTVTDEGGHTTTYRYDLDGADPAASGRLTRIELPDATLPDGSTQTSALRLEWDARGRLVALVTAEGMRTELGYAATGDGRGLLSEVRHDAAGLDLVERLTRDAVGDVVALEDPTGAVRELGYDERRRLVRAVTAPLGGQAAVVELVRDGEGNVTELRRPRGDYDDPALSGTPVRDVAAYDVLGRLVSTTLAANTVAPRHAQLCLDHRGQAVAATDAGGNRVVQVFDERGMLLSREAQGADGTRLRETSVYDVAGRRTHHRTGPLADLLGRYEYDGFGRVRHVTSANGSVLTYTWGSDDLLTEESVEGDPGDGVPRLLRRTRYEYDERGRVLRETRSSFRDDPATAVDVTATYAHDGDNNRVAVTDPRGLSTGYVHDALGRLVEVVDPAGNRVVHEYEGLDRVVRTERHDVTPGGTVVGAWAHRYDVRGRRVEDTDPLGQVTTLEYDDRDVVVAVTAPGGVVERRRTGPCGELLEVLRDAGGIDVRHTWQYDELGRMTAYVDPTGQATTIGYDGVGRRVSVSRPGFTSTRTVGADGRVSVEQLLSGASVRTGYDAAGRLHTVEGVPVAGMAPVDTAELRYDGLDRLVSASAGGSVTAREFDSLGRLVGETRDGVRLQAEYDDLTGAVVRRWPDGREERLTTGPGGFPLQVERTAAGTLGDDGADVATVLGWGPARAAERTLAGTLTATTDHDDGGRPTRLDYRTADGQVEVFDYRFDQRGRRRYEQTRVRPSARLWESDDVDRVTRAADGFAPPLTGAPPATQADHDSDIGTATGAAAGAADVHGFSWSVGDDRLEHTRSGAPPVGYTHQPGHRVATAGGETITHHPDGARASDAAHGYTVDVFGRVTEVTAGGAAVVTFTYDALGRPAGMTAGGTTTLFHYFGEELLLETRGGSASRQYSTDPRGGAPLAVHLPGRTLLPVSDLSASCRAYCDVAGEVLEAYTYEPFGAPATFAPDGTPRASSAIGLEPVFAGLRWVSEAGLYLSRARLYDPRHGLFLSPDPLGQADSPNPYAYARQDPADYVDPEGRLAFLAVLGIVAVGALVGGGLNATRQAIAISEGAQESFSWSELGLNTLLGGVLAPVAVFAPEIAIPLAAMGVASGADEISRGNYATGIFDIGTSALGVFGAVRSPSFGAPASVRVTNAKVVIARTDLNQTELGLQIQRLVTRNPDTRAGLQRQIGDVRLARSILDDPSIAVRTYDPRTRSVTERPLGFDPSELGWDGVRRDVNFYRPDGSRAGDIDLGFPRFDIEIKLGERASDTTGKVAARDTFLPGHQGRPYYLASEIPADVMARWQQYPRAVPIDLRTAATQSFDGHIQVTPAMRGGLPYFFRDVLAPDRVPYFFPSVGAGRK